MVTLGLLAVVLGALRTISSWDFPTYFLLAAAAVAAASWIRAGRLTIGGLVLVGVQIAFLYLGSLLAFWPFHQSYELFYTGVDPSKERTLPVQYVGVHGFFLFAVLSFLVLEWVRLISATGTARWLKLALARWDRFPHLLALTGRLVKRQSPWPALALLGAMGLAGVVAALNALDYGTVGWLLALLALVAVVGGVELARGRAADPARLFVVALVGLAIGLGIGVDLVTIKGDINRMNTVFKFYLQAWVLYAIASAACLWWVIDQAGGRGSGLHPRNQKPEARNQKRLSASPVGRAWLIVLAGLVASVSIYPLMATPVRVSDRFANLPPTLDGAAYMTRSVYQEEKGPVELRWDYEAIRWLEENVQGTPVVLEAASGSPPHVGLYRWGNRVSIYTGLPTVIGWDWHQKQQRWGYQRMVDERLNDVRTFFTSPDPQAALEVARKYNVQYVYVGKMEKLYYPAQGLAKLQQLVGRGLEVAYQNPDVTIYRVRQ
ncbi:MAG: hypothetical protein HY331_16270 [Chloroflexi bacterium]|nr:hypothetical protein [Chloroflexota bacterium]